MSELLPVFLNLAGRQVVLVGGGHVATAKLRQLLAAEASECADGASRADASAAAALAAGAARAAAKLVAVNLATTPGDERIAAADRAVEAAEDAAKIALMAEI